MVADERSLRQEFEDALIELQRLFELVRVLSNDNSVDPLTVHRARESYERARLVWLSCDLRLRSAGISSAFDFRQSKAILIYSGAATVRHPLISVLKARGYVPVLVETVNELYAATRNSRFAAVVAYIEPAMWHAPSFVQYLERVSQPLPLITVPRSFVEPASPDDASVPPPLMRLFQELDSALRPASRPARTAPRPDVLRRTDPVNACR